MTLALLAGALGLAGCGSDGIEPTPLPTVTPWPPLTPALSPLATDRSNVLLVLVHTGVAEAIRPGLAILEQDLRNEGWDPELQVGSPEPQQLRAFLAAAQPSLRGAFLIGSIPYATCEADDDRGPCDLYLMDVDGQWLDSDGNGALDAHAGAGADREPELILGRLWGGNLTLFGQSEGQMYQSYLARDHAYRTGATATSGRALYATLIDHHYGWYDPRSAVDSREVLEAQSQWFPENWVLLFDQQVDPVTGELWQLSTPADKRTGRATDLMLDALSRGLDLATMGGHGWHEGWGGVVDTTHIADLVRRGQPLPVIVDSHGCTTGGFQHANSICAAMTMGGSLAFVGASLVTTSFPAWDIAFRDALGRGTIGSAMVRYHQRAIETQGRNTGPKGVDLRGQYTSSNRVLLGDPTLRLRLHPR